MVAVDGNFDMGGEGGRSRGDEDKGGDGEESARQPEPLSIASRPPTSRRVLFVSCRGVGTRIHCGTGELRRGRRENGGTELGSTGRV